MSRSVLPKPEMRAVPDDAILVDKPSAVVVGVEREPLGAGKTTAQQDAYKTQFIKVYQDAGVIGTAMLTLLVIIVILGSLCTRILRMYRDLATNRDEAETRRLQYFDTLTQSVKGVETAVGSLKNSLEIEKNERNVHIATMQRGVDRTTKLLEDYVFERKGVSR